MDSRPIKEGITKAKLERKMVLSKHLKERSLLHFFLVP